MDVLCRPVTSGGTVFCSLILYPSSAFPESSSELWKRGQSTTPFPSTLLSEGRRRCLTRPAVLCSCLNTPPHTCPSNSVIVRGSLGATVGRASAAPFPDYSLGGVFSGGVIVLSLALLICPLGHCLTNSSSLLSRIPYSTWPSLPVFYPRVPRSYGREVEVRHLFPSTLLSVGC